jgi:mannose-6-phosphate isomerase-like protein (cupin superfamily)
VTGCRTASIVAFGTLFVSGTVGACRQQAEPTVPPVTTAQPTMSADPVLSGPAGDASLATAPPAPIEAGAPPVPAVPSPVQAAISDLPVKIDLPSSCMEVAVAVVSGSATALGEPMKAGDVLVAHYADPFEVKGTGMVVTAVARDTNEACSPQKKLTVVKQVVRASSTPEITWAKGAMKARLQVGEKQKSRFYLGRLEVTSPIGEHVHEGTWEILAAIDAAGTFVRDGQQSRVGPRQVVVVPPDTKHEWRPDPGSKLVAVQMYSPPGPEQRFLALAAADKDAGAASAPPAK